MVIGKTSSGMTRGEGKRNVSTGGETAKRKKKKSKYLVKCRLEGNSGEEVCGYCEVERGRAP